VGSGQTVQFDIGNGPAPILILNDPSHFQAQIKGFQGSDQIDLPTITFTSDTTKAAYADNGVAGDNTGGTLTISRTDASGNPIEVLATITFKDGNYTTASFKLSDDGSGHILIKDPPTDASTTIADATTTTDASVTIPDASTTTADASTTT